MPAATSPPLPRYDVARLKDAARGCWPQVFEDLASIPGDILDGEHHPCPKCGGTDRFRLLDADVGALYCNQCFNSENGDGISALQWFCGWSYPETLQQLSEFFNVLEEERDQLSAAASGTTITTLDTPNTPTNAARPGEGGHSTESESQPEAKDPARSLEFRSRSKIQLSLWCEKKPGVTVAALELCGAQLAKHLKEYSVIAIPAYGSSGPDSPAVGWIVTEQGGGQLPIFHGPGKPKTWEKVKVTSGSEAGLVNEHALRILADPIRRAMVEVIWKVEGYSDCAALQALIPVEFHQTHLVVSNSDGATGKARDWMLSLFSLCPNLKLFNVVHDCDKPGQTGAIGETITKGKKKKLKPGWCQRVAGAFAAAQPEAIAAPVRNVVLPFLVTESDGKDLRDWINGEQEYRPNDPKYHSVPPENNPAAPEYRKTPRTYNQLLSLAESMPAIAAPVAAVASPYIRTPSDSSDGTDDTDPSKDTWADGIPDGVVCNGIPKPDGEDKETSPLSMSSILKRVYHVARSWPRRVGSQLFVHEEGSDRPAHWLDKPDAVMGYLGSVGKYGPPRFYNGAGFHTKAEVFSELQRLSVNYRAIETIPHEPPIKDHYYAHAPIDPVITTRADTLANSNTIQPDDFHAGNGILFDKSPQPSKLEQLLSRFSPTTDIDRDLILAMFATSIWGGPGGTRPLFVITSRDGRGVGKSTVPEMLGQLVGGCMAFSPGEELEEVKKRLLSPEGASKRLALIDNLKTYRFSWAEFESLVTAREISGRQMYVGESSRPNILTWIATVNGLSASTDIAQRSVIIYLNRPTHTGDWYSETREFIEANRREVLADLITFLRRPQFLPTKHTRWGEWEKSVLSRLPEPSEAQRVILERQRAADVEDEEGGIFTEYIHKQMKTLGYDDDDLVFIPSILMAQWHFEATKERHSVTATTRMIKQRIEEGATPQLIVRPHKGGKRGFVWRTSGFVSPPTGPIPKIDLFNIRENLEDAIEHEKEKKTRLF